MPHQTDILVHGVAEDEERLQELISNPSYFCFVVYPSEDAVPVTTISSTLAKCSKIPVAVLIDGTWNQAQRMHKHFEEMQHVVVFPTGAVLKNTTKETGRMSGCKDCVEAVCFVVL